MSETKELVEELEDLLKEPCFFTDRYISLFTEIKGILEQQAQPSEELACGLEQPKNWKCPKCGGSSAFPDPSGYAKYQKEGWGCSECQS